MLSQEKSKLKNLEPPEFKPTIPPHMLAQLSDQDRYVFETLSVMEARENWLVTAARENRQNLIDIDTMARSTYIWKERLTSRWGVITAAAVLVAPVVLKTLADIWLKN